MRRAVALLALVAVCAFALAAAAPRTDYPPDALKDEITNLTGAPKINFRQFGGYIPINAAGRKIFYWFVEASEADPATAPVFLWTNGGPGCSGLGGGMMTELGPFVPHKDGTLTLREHAWNKKINIIFVEQPAGVGFSILEDSSVEFGDDLAASNNVDLIRGWFKKFSNYANAPFYLASESYGGHYLPTLALALVKTASDVNFKGFMVGNPLSYMPFRDFGNYAAYAARQLIPRPEWDAYIALGCRPNPDGPYPNPAPARPSGCASYESKFDGYAANMDPYALDFPVCTDSAAGRNERAHFMARMALARKAAALKSGNGHLLTAADAARPLNSLNLPPGTSALRDYFPDYDPCAEEWTTTYLNRADVQKALHAVKPVLGWSICANINYSSFDMVTAMMPIYRELVKRKAGQLNMLVFSGDDDAVCSPQDSQMWLWTMGLSVKDNWRQWHTADTNVAGFTVGLDGLRFSTIHGAGHMAPSTRPAQTYQALENYLSGVWK